MRSGSLRTAALACAVAIAGGAPTASPTAAQEWREFRAARQGDGYRALAVQIAFGAGTFSLAPSERDYLYDVELRYDAARFLPVRSWSEEDGTGRLRVALTSAREGGGVVRLDDRSLSFDLEDLRRLGDSSGRLTVALGRSVPLDLTISVGAAESSLELGGLPLTRLEMDTGASQTRLRFSEPNPVALERMSLKVGAASFRAEGLGNARAREFEFSGGVGDVHLDFTGSWEGSVRARIRMGVGALALRFPRDAGVRIRKTSFLTAFDAPGFARVGDAWQTENWEGARRRLEADLDAAFGAVDVRLVP